MGRFLGVDPLADKYPFVSVYCYVGNNPLNIVDPNGMDWYMDSSGVYRFDPNVKKETKLPNGCTYVEAFFDTKTQNGSVVYRVDGSIVFSSETDAYKRMLEVRDRETLCIITDDGAMILPDYKNTPSDCSPSLNDFGYGIAGYHLYDPVEGAHSSAISTVHTHCDPSRDPQPSREDASTFGRLLPFKMSFVLAYNDRIYAYEPRPLANTFLGIRYQALVR
jgi:hypothetical protein